MIFRSVLSLVCPSLHPYQEAGNVFETKNKLKIFSRKKKKNPGLSDIQPSGEECDGHQASRGGHQDRHHDVDRVGPRHGEKSVPGPGLGQSPAGLYY